MSEYQYYEFQAVDRMLSAQEMSELRRCSSRARITRASFVNHYEWGSFGGDDNRWMDDYFDAHLYLSNWGTRLLMLRLPANLLNPTATRTYCPDLPFAARRKNDKVVLTFTSDLDPDEEWTDGEGILSSILPVRTELARGDRRALYLGWLLTVNGHTHKESVLEPPVPPGLQQLSPSLEALAEFLRLDPDLLEVAAEASLPIATAPARQDLAGWIVKLPTAEQKAWLVRVVTDDAQAVAGELLRHFNEHCASGIRNDTKPGQRTVGDLQRAAADRAVERKRIAKQTAATDRVQRQHKAAREREAQLDLLAGSERRLWTKVGKLIATTQPANYDSAAALLVDLRDLGLRTGTGTFSKRLEKLRASHSRKGSLLRRLAKAGL